MTSEADDYGMRLALDQAQNAWLVGEVPVGAVIVRPSADGPKVIATGYNRPITTHDPTAHAEIVALRHAAQLLQNYRLPGCTLYVTLEPCSHFGRTPPCADALIAAGIARLVVAMQDPNPLVAGQGLARLAAAGIEVASGLLGADATELNIGFVSRMTRGRPWLRLKVAASLDGKTALNNGVSQWITGPDARRDAHAWRARSCAVLTGIGTVKAVSYTHLTLPTSDLV